MFRQILVAVDGSASGERALFDAIDLAQAHRARLTILTAIPHRSAFAVFAGPVAVPLSDQLEAQSEGILRRAADAVPDDVSVTTILTRAPLRDALVELAVSGPFDVLVMGSHGRGAVGAAVRGSVSHRLLKRSSISVLVVQPAAEPAVRRNALHAIADVA